MLTSIVSFALLGPYSFLTGVLSLDFGGNAAVRPPPDWLIRPDTWGQSSRVTVSARSPKNTAGPASFIRSAPSRPLPSLPPACTGTCTTYDAPVTRRRPGTRALTGLVARWVCKFIAGRAKCGFDRGQQRLAVLTARHLPTAILWSTLMTNPSQTPRSASLYSIGPAPRSITAVSRRSCRLSRHWRIRRARSRSTRHASRWVSASATICKALLQMPRIGQQWQARMDGRGPKQISIASTRSNSSRASSPRSASIAELIPGLLEDWCAWLRPRHQDRHIDRLLRRGRRLTYAAAAEQGYTPDHNVTPGDGPAGRPAPWMIYRNMEALGVYPAVRRRENRRHRARHDEGLAAGVWSIGVTHTGSDVGLTAKDFAALGAGGPRGAAHRSGPRSASHGRRPLSHSVDQGAARI